jgi:hypothetical protein
MEKRKAKTAGDTAGAYTNCKAVLDRGLEANPKSFLLVQVRSSATLLLLPPVVSLPTCDAPVHSTRAHVAS